MAAYLNGESSPVNFIAKDLGIKPTTCKFSRNENPTDKELKNKIRQRHGSQRNPYPLVIVKLKRIETTTRAFETAPLA